MLVDPSCPNRTEQDRFLKDMFLGFEREFFLDKIVVHRTLYQLKLWRYKQNRDKKRAI